MMDEDKILEEKELENWDKGFYPDEKKVKKAEKPKYEDNLIEYIGEFKALIDYCGQVSYYWSMQRGLKSDLQKAKIIASAYEHDAKYYADQKKSFIEKAKCSMKVLRLNSKKMKLPFISKEEEEKDLLNSLTVSKDKRNAYKEYIETMLKNGKKKSIFELEEKYQNRLRKRLKKK